MAHPIINQLVRSLEATLRTGQAFPADKYDYRPAPGCMTVGEQIEHLAHNFDWVIEPIAAALEITAAADKPERPLEHLAWSQNRFIDILSQVPDDGWDREVSYPDDFSMPIARGALVMLEHDAHHRGQLIIYLHQLEIKPPKRWPNA